MINLKAITSVSKMVWENNNDSWDNYYILLGIANLKYNNVRAPPKDLCMDLRVYPTM